MKMIHLALLLLTASASAFAKPNIQPLSLVDTIVAQERGDGNFDVVCKDGTREVVTSIDLMIENVCPHQENLPTGNILSAQNRGDGTFDVVCKDLTKKVVTTEDIRSGAACPTNNNSGLILNEGLYKVTSGQTSYCPQTIRRTVEGNKVTQLRVKFESPCSASRDMTCDESGFCQSSDYQIQIQSKTTYEFAQRGGREPGTFSFEKP